MELRQRIFLRTVALLGVLVLVTALLYILFIVRQNRRILDENTHEQIVFVAYQAERLILWDDRVALSSMLKELVSNTSYYDYAFVEMNGEPYADTFNSGVPSGLLGRNYATGEVGSLEFRDEKGDVFYDHTYRDSTTGAVVHIGMSRDKMDAMAGGVVRTIALYSGFVMLICLVPGWIVSSAITSEVARMNSELNQLNRELEARVDARTAELVKANEALKNEMVERARLEKQRDEFLSMCRHDMRSPLAVIRGYAELLQPDISAKLGPEAAGMADAVIRNTVNLSKMIDDFSELSRLESGMPILGKERVELSEIAAEVYISFKVQADATGITLVNETPEGMPIVSADSHYIRRAVANLVSNAINYTPAGGRVRLTGGTTDGTKAATVYIEVTDTGPGIPEDERDLIFDKYYRARGSSGVNGSGLGLAIVKAVMDACRGRVELATEPGKGSTFRLVFPLSV